MRRLTSMMLSLLIAALLSLGAAEAEGCTIVHLSDLHYLSPALTDGGEAFMTLLREGDGKVTHYTPQLLRAFIEEMMALRPDAVVVSGDLTMNGALQSHRELASQLEELVNAGIQVFVLPGNHDLTKGAYRFTEKGAVIVDGTSGEDFAALYGRCGYDGALARDTDTWSYTAEVVPGVRLLLVDVNAEGMAGSLTRSLLDWTEVQLQEAQAAGDLVIGVSHQNLLEHNEQFTTDYIIGYALMLRRQWEHYGVTLHLSGHLHIQHIAQSNGLTEIAASSLSVWPLQYGIVTVEEDAIHYETHQVDVSTWAAENAVEDANLLDFDRYARDFFELCNRTRLTKRMENWAIPDEDAQAMQALFLRLNAPYFAGRPLTGLDTSEMALWDSYLPEYPTTSYLHAMLLHPEQDSNVLLLPLSR